MGYSECNQVLLVFGTIRPYKGIDIAIQAFAELITEYPGVRLLIAGKLWEDWTPYQELIDKFGLSSYVCAHLEYIPADEVYKYFEVSDISIFPYRHFDSQSGAAAAAVSFGKPIIVTSVGGLPEFTDDSRCIVPPDDSHALARAICYCLSGSGEKRNKATAGSPVASRLDWTKIAEKTVAVYDHLIKQTK